MNNIEDLMLKHLGWYVSMKPIDLTNKLPRHPSKEYKRRSRDKCKRIVVHTSNWETTPEKLAEYDITPYFMVNGEKIYNHISKTGCPGITYHECFMNDGTIYKTLPYEEISWHAGVWNNGSLGFCLMYVATNKDTGLDEYIPPINMLRSLQTRLGDVCLELGLSPDKVVGHRELKGTGWFMSKGSKKYRKTCPGMKVDLDKLRTNVAMYMQILLKYKSLYKGAVDGLWGLKSQAALVRW